MSHLSSIQSALSPLRFSVPKLGRFNRIDDTKHSKAHSAKAEKNHPALTGNPQKIAENRILRAIEKVLGADKVSSPKLNQGGFDPEKLTDKILQYVKQSYRRLQNDNPNFEEAEFFNLIKQGIEAGFNEAREALNELELLEGPLIDRLDSAYDKIQQELSILRSADRQSPMTPAQLQGFSAQIKESAQIEIVTKEGDVVKIRLAQSSENRQSNVNLEQDGIAATIEQNYSETSGVLSITVEGNLNDEEQESLKELLQDMDTVRHDFFGGNFQAAFDHARQIGFDSEQIASFSMSLSLEKSVKAIAAYRQAGSPDQQIEPDKLKQAADFFNRAREMVKSAESILQPFKNPLSVFTLLFDAVNEAGSENHIESEFSQTHSDLPQMVKPLGESIFSDSKPIQA